MKAIAGYMIEAEIMIAAISGGIISALVLCPGFLEAFTGMAAMGVFLFIGAAILISLISAICYSAGQRTGKSNGNGACRR